MALKPKEIEEIFSKLGRARTRKELFIDCVWGAVGRLFDRVREERNNILAKRGEPELTAGDVASFCQGRFPGQKGNGQMAPHLIREFLNGSTPGETPWGKIAPVMLAFILCAKVKQSSNQEKSFEFDEKKLPAPAQEFIRYFLLHNNREKEMTEEPTPYDATPDKWDMPTMQWYFGPFVPEQPATTREVFREWEITRQRIHSGDNSEARMVRVGSVDHFRMVIRLDDGGYRLSPTGSELLKCIESGIQQIFIYPANDAFSVSPRESVEAFAGFVETRLGVEGLSLIKPIEIPLGINPRAGDKGRKRFSFELFNHEFRWVWYEWKSSQNKVQNRLWVSRHPGHGPCLFDAAEDDKELFSEWLKLFAEPYLQGQQPPRPTRASKDSQRQGQSRSKSKRSVTKKSQ